MTTIKTIELLEAESRMHKAWARANEALKEVFELEGRAKDAKEAGKAAREEWAAAAKTDREVAMRREAIERDFGAPDGAGEVSG